MRRPVSSATATFVSEEVPEPGVEHPTDALVLHSRGLMYATIRLQRGRGTGIRGREA